MPTFRQDEKLGTKVPLIKTADFNDKSVTTEKLAEGSVTNSKLAPESVTQDKFDKELLQIFKAAAGLPENLIETIQNVDSTLVDHQRQISSNDDDISDLQTKTKQIKDTVDGIAISGGASVGSAVTYDNTQSGLDAQNIQNAIDELVNNLGHYETNEEWLRAYTDAENKFLWGIRIDGSIDWAVGIPRPIQKKIEELIATDTAIQESITQLRTELTESLNKNIKSLKDNEIKNLQDTKVDKEEDKSLIEDEVKECFRVIENEEFIMAVVDSEDRYLFGIYRDSGKPYFPLNEMYHVEQNEEFFAVWLDAANHVLLGIRRDGQIIGEIHAVNALKQVISQLQSDVASLQEKVGTIDVNLKELLDVFSLQENEEYLAVEQDAEGKVLSSTNADGSHYIYNVKSETIPTEFSHIEDPEGRTEITTDAEDKILGYRDSEGTRHEHKISVNHIDLSNEAANEVNETFKSAGISFDTKKIYPRVMDLPKYGKVNIKSEIYYTDSANNYYPSNDVAKINGEFYTKASLNEGLPTESSVKVTEVIGIPQLDKWAIDKSIKHKCIIEIDFGSYLSGTFYVEVKYQGSSTLYNPKHNFRFAFYNDENFSKKKKIKIGEMIETSGYNLKAFYSDPLRLKEPLMNRIILAISETTSFVNRYPWNADYPIFTSATGLIKQFPCRVEVSGDFYGLMYFGLKKDGGNYMLSKDADGMIVSGEYNEEKCWSEYVPGHWTDELNDELTETNEAALQKFYSFINSTDFNKENTPIHLSVDDFINYFVIVQTFLMRDSLCKNLMLYTKEDKTKFYPFFYDLDLSWAWNIEDNPNIMDNGVAFAKDISFWRKFVSLYYDECCDRYKQLRTSVLNIEYITNIATDLMQSINYSDFSEECSKWNVIKSKSISDLLAMLEKRFNWLDNVYFKK